jgi:hypothetical protein
MGVFIIRTAMRMEATLCLLLVVGWTWRLEEADTAFGWSILNISGG